MEDDVSDHRDDASREPGDEPLRETFDMDAWDVQAPPGDFAERVLAKVRDEKKAAEPAARPAEKRARRWGLAAGGAAALALAAAFALKIGSTKPSHGEAIAKERIEVSIGDRARAVLEPGASVKWDGDDVVQAKGDVFYRVEPGARFRVHTGAGDVEVKGTCFTVKVRGEAKEESIEMQKRDVKSGAIGAALTALAFVAVYEGKVAVSHAGERAELAAGESAQLGADGVKRTGDLGEGQKAFDAKLAAQGGAEEPLAKANENLVAQVQEYKTRLEAIATQKSDLEDKLKKAEEKLASSGDASAPRGGRSEWELDKDDWAELAKKGSVKYRMPCPQKGFWTFSPEKLNKLGLSPQDGPILRDAYQRSYERVWSQIRPMCLKALGNAEIVDKVGLPSCPFLIYDIEQAIDPEATKEAHTQVAEIRAGLRPEPGPNEKVHPVLRTFLILTASNGWFEQDLAKTYGPEEAHRLAYSDDMCNSNSQWGGGKKREAEKK
jgi:hypothetical protein